MKIFNDPVHGHIELRDTDISIIDTPQFQRLRELRQLGVSYYVFPGASHNRFEHSIGVCHLAGSWAKLLQKEQPELKITENDVKCVRIAGLCHDLGHGPFSHLFDNHVMPALDPEPWTHEEASEEMFEHLVSEYKVDLSKNEVNFIKDLIHGEPRSDYPQAKKLFLFDIVSNKRNSIDVDKFDYILRDCHNTGIHTGFDPGRLMKFARVIDNQICFKQQEAFNLYQLFHTRYSLFKQIYTHKVSTAIEYMVRDILVSAAAELKILEHTRDMAKYTFLNDSILTSIERSTSRELMEARKILRRLRVRDLYKCVDQVIIPYELHSELSEKDISANKILKYCESDEIKESDIIVQWMTLNYAMKDKNPVDSVKFYSKHDNSKSVFIKKEHVSGLIPEHYKELIIRIFTREPHLTARIQYGFRRLLERINEKLMESALEAESYSEIPDTATLADFASQIESKPIADSTNNPFLSSPNIQTKSRPPVFSSPMRRLLETNKGLSIPQPVSQSLRKIRNDDQPAKKRVRKSFPATFTS